MRETLRSRMSLLAEEVAVEMPSTFRADTVTHHASSLRCDLPDDFDHFLAFRADADKSVPFLDFLHVPLPLLLPRRNRPTQRDCILSSGRLLVNENRIENRKIRNRSVPDKLARRGSVRRDPAGAGRLCFCRGRDAF